MASINELRNPMQYVYETSRSWAGPAVRMRNLWHIAVVCLLMQTVGARPVQVPDCGYQERLNSEGSCEPCPVCPRGQGYNQSCGYGEGQGVECSPCPEHTYRDTDDPSDQTCKTCFDCENAYNQQYKYKCRPVVNSVCGACLPGYYPLDSTFIKLPCRQCEEDSTNEACVAYREQRAKEQQANNSLEHYPILQEKFTQIEEESRKQNQSIRDLEAQILAKKKTVNDLEAAVLAKNKTINDFTEKLTQIEEESRKQNQSIRDLETEILAKNKTVNDLKAAVLAKNKTINDFTEKLNDSENEIIKWKVWGLIVFFGGIASLGGCVLFICLYRHRGRQREKEKRPYMAIPEKPSDPLLHSGTAPEVCTRMQCQDSMVPLQTSSAVGAQPQYSLEEDSGTHSNLPNGHTDPSGLPDCSADPASTDSAPSSGIYSMTPSQASTALVQPSPLVGALFQPSGGALVQPSVPGGAQGQPSGGALGQPSLPAGALSLDENAATALNSSDASLQFSLGPSISIVAQPPCRPENVRILRPDNLAIPLISHAIPQEPGPWQQGVQGHDVAPQALQDGCGAPAGQRGPSSQLAKKDQETFEKAKAQVGERRVADLGQTVQDELAAIMNQENCPCAPSFHITAEKLGVGRDTFRTWKKADDLLCYCCSKDTSMHDLLEALHLSGLTRARNRLARHVLMENHNPCNDQGPGNQRYLDPENRRPRSPETDPEDDRLNNLGYGAMHYDCRNHGSEMSNSLNPSLALPSFNQREPEDRDEEQGAVGGQESPLIKPEEESKGLDSYPVQCTAQPLTPTGSREFHPFAIRRQNSRS